MCLQETGISMPSKSLEVNAEPYSLKRRKTKARKARFQKINMKHSHLCISIAFGKGKGGMI
uniref:Uncharacterized protein n=1 Tax=Anguilla anguilla TaxID=7936 RepID=A0A0E9UEM5_ANGAN